MFQGVLGGSGSSSLPITHQKYLRIREHVDRFLRLLAALRESNLMTTHFPDMRAHLVAYTAALQAQFAKSFSAPDFSPYMPQLAGAAAAAGPTPSDYARVPEAAFKEFEAVFAAIKTCSLVNTILVVCKNLIPHKTALNDQAALKDKFLLRDAGSVFAPLPDLSQLNFKRIYIDVAISASDRSFVMIILHKMLKISHDVYEALSAPDVDVDEFVEVIMSSIDEVKKHIPRCDQAFDKIVESVGMLRGNFNNYYKDYVSSGNVSIMMENFVLDVSKSTNANPQVTGQFRRIITHYRKLASQQSSNPKLQNLFAQVDANFKELEKATGTKTGDAEAAAAPKPTVSNDTLSAEIAAAEAAAAAAALPAAPGKNAARNKQKRAKAKAKKAGAEEAGAEEAGAEEAGAEEAGAEEAEAEEAGAEEAEAEEAEAEEAEAETPQ